MQGNGILRTKTSGSLVSCLARASPHGLPQSLHFLLFFHKNKKCLVLPGFTITKAAALAKNWLYVGFTLFYHAQSRLPQCRTISDPGFTLVLPGCTGVCSPGMEWFLGVFTKFSGNARNAPTWPTPLPRSSTPGITKVKRASTQRCASKHHTPGIRRLPSTTLYGLLVPAATTFLRVRLPFPRRIIT